MTTTFDPRHRDELPDLVDNLEQALDAEPALRLSRGNVPRELLDPPTMTGLVRMTLEEWAMMAALWAAIALTPWWLYPVTVFLLAGRYHALGVILHDATHMPLRRKSLGARVVETLCGYPIASTINAMRYHHLRHHRDSGMETDPYFKGGRRGVFWWMLNIARGALLVPFWTLRAVVGVASLAVPRLRNTYAHVFMQDRTRADLTNSREVIDCARADVGQFVFQLLVVAAIVAWPRPLLLGYLIPVTIAGFFAARRVLIEHNYEHTADRRIETIVATTNDNHLGWLGSVALAPRNIGYHVVHHIHPQVGLTHLPQLREWYVQQHPDIYLRGELNVGPGKNGA